MNKKQHFNRILAPEAPVYSLHHEAGTEIRSTANSSHRTLCVRVAVAENEARNLPLR